MATGTAVRAPVRERRPGSRKPLLRRGRPLSLLHQSIGNGLTVIQAPAGCGKTALAMQFADELDFSVAWVALDSACASPEVFAERLARVLAGPAFPAPVTAAPTRKPPASSVIVRISLMCLMSTSRSNWSPLWAFAGRPCLRLPVSPG